MSSVPPQMHSPAAPSSKGLCLIRAEVIRLVRVFQRGSAEACWAMLMALHGYDSVILFVAYYMIIFMYYTVP